MLKYFSPWPSLALSLWLYQLTPPSPIKITGTIVSGERAAAWARAACLHRTHRCLLRQPGERSSCPKKIFLHRECSYLLLMSTLGPLRLTLTVLSPGLILMIPTLICWALYEVNNMCSPGPAKAGVQEHFLGERIYGTTGIRRYSQIIFLWSVSWPIAVRIWLCSEKGKLELLRPSSSNLPGWWTTQRQKLVNFHYDPRFLRQQLLHLQYLYHIPLFKVNWTRISEYKHSPNQPAGVRDYPGTVVSISISLCTVVSINH